MPDEESHNEADGTNLGSVGKDGIWNFGGKTEHPPTPDQKTEKLAR